MGSSVSSHSHHGAEDKGGGTDRQSGGEGTDQSHHNHQSKSHSVHPLNVNPNSFGPSSSASTSSSSSSSSSPPIRFPSKKDLFAEVKNNNTEEVKSPSSPFTPEHSHSHSHHATATSSLHLNPKKPIRSSHSHQRNVSLGFQLSQYLDSDVKVKVLGAPKPRRNSIKITTNHHHTPYNQNQNQSDGNAAVHVDPNLHDMEKKDGVDRNNNNNNIHTILNDNSLARTISLTSMSPLSKNNQNGNSTLNAIPKEKEKSNKMKIVLGSSSFASSTPPSLPSPHRSLLQNTSSNRTNSNSTLPVPTSPAPSNISSSSSSPSTSTWFDLLYSRYLPIMVRDRFHLSPSPLISPEYEQFDASVAFIDISGFTAMSEKLVNAHGTNGAELLNKYISSYFKHLIDMVVEYGGDVVKFAGDAVQVVWRNKISLPKEKEKEKDGNVEEKNNIPHTNISPRSSSPPPSFPSPTDTPLSPSLLLFRCIECCFALLSSMNNVNVGGHDLSLHIGCSAGKMESFYVGGVDDQWEFFVTGPPVKEVGDACDAAQSGQLVCHSNVIQWVNDKYNTKKSTGGMFLLLPPSSTPAASSLSSSAHSVSPHRMKYVPARISPAEELALSSFIPPIVRRRLDSGHSSHWLSEFRRCYVMFVALPSFSYEDSSTALPLLHQTVRIVQSTILKYEGTVARLLCDDKGTRFKIVFGMPTMSHEDDAFRVVLSAIEIEKGLSTLSVRCCIGIASGTVYCGNAGSDIRCEYTAVGFKVIMAARLMQMAISQSGNNGGNSNLILLDEAIRSSCQQKIWFEALTPVKLKGVQALVNIYRPLGEKKNQGGKANKLLGLEKNQKNGEIENNNNTNGINTNGNSNATANASSSSSTDIVNIRLSAPLKAMAAAARKRANSFKHLPSLRDAADSPIITRKSLQNINNPNGNDMKGAKENTQGESLNSLSLDDSLPNSVQNGAASSSSSLPPSHPPNLLPSTSSTVSSSPSSSSPPSSFLTPSPVLPPSDVIVGRDSEMEYLQTLLSSVQSTGHTCVLMIEGDGGVGKSSLISKLCQRQKGLCSSYIGVSSSIDSRSPYYIWRQLLEGMLSLSNLTQSNRKMSALVDEVPYELHTWLPLLNPLLGLSFPSTTAVDTLSDDESRGKNTQRLLLSLIGIHHQTTRMIILEDVQSVDSASWELLLEVSRLIPNIFIILTSRPLDIDGNAFFYVQKISKFPWAKKLKLAELQKSEMNKLLESRMQSYDIPPQLSNFIYERSKGHPLFTEEICKELVEKKYLFVDQTTRRVNIVGNLSQLSSNSLNDPSSQSTLNTVAALSDTLQQMLVGRIDRVANDLQMTLKTSAVIGNPIKLKMLQFCHPNGMDREGIKKHCNELCTMGFLYSDVNYGDKFYFKNQFYLSAAYSMLSLDQRRELHMMAASYIESNNPHSTNQRVFASLAHHFSFTNHHNKTIHYTLSAGKLALSANANHEAVKMFEFVHKILDNHNKRNEIANGEAIRCINFASLGQAYYNVGKFSLAIGQFDGAMKIFSPSFELPKEKKKRDNENSNSSPENSTESRKKGRKNKIHSAPSPSHHSTNKLLSSPSSSPPKDILPIGMKFFLKWNLLKDKFWRWKGKNKNKIPLTPTLTATESPRVPIPPSPLTMPIPANTTLLPLRPSPLPSSPSSSSLSSYDIDMERISNTKQMILLLDKLVRSSLLIGKFSSALYCCFKMNEMAFSLYSPTLIALAATQCAIVGREIRQEGMSREYERRVSEYIQNQRSLFGWIDENVPHPPSSSSSPRPPPPPLVTPSDYSRLSFNLSCVYSYDGKWDDLFTSLKESKSFHKSGVEYRESTLLQSSVWFFTGKFISSQKGFSAMRRSATADGDAPLEFLAHAMMGALEVLSGGYRIMTNDVDRINAQNNDPATSAYPRSLLSSLQYYSNPRVTENLHCCFDIIEDANLSDGDTLIAFIIHQYYHYYNYRAIHIKNYNQNNHEKSNVRSHDDESKNNPNTPNPTANINETPLVNYEEVLSFGEKISPMIGDPPLLPCTSISFFILLELFITVLDDIHRGITWKINTTNHGGNINVSREIPRCQSLLLHLLSRFSSFCSVYPFATPIYQFCMGRYHLNMASRLLSSSSSSFPFPHQRDAHHHERDGLKFLTESIEGSEKKQLRVILVRGLMEKGTYLHNKFTERQKEMKKKKEKGRGNDDDDKKKKKNDDDDDDDDDDDSDEGFPLLTRCVTLVRKLRLNPLQLANMESLAEFSPQLILSLISDTNGNDNLDMNSDDGNGHLNRNQTMGGITSGTKGSKGEMITSLSSIPIPFASTSNIHQYNYNRNATSNPNLRTLPASSSVSVNPLSPGNTHTSPTTMARPITFMGFGNAANSMANLLDHLEEWDEEGNGEKEKDKEREREVVGDGETNVISSVSGIHKGKHVRSPNGSILSGSNGKTKGIVKNIPLVPRINFPSNDLNVTHLPQYPSDNESKHQNSSGMASEMTDKNPHHRLFSHSSIVVSKVDEGKMNIYSDEEEEGGGVGRVVSMSGDGQGDGKGNLNLLHPNGKINGNAKNQNVPPILPRKLSSLADSDKEKEKDHRKSILQVPFSFPTSIHADVPPSPREREMGRESYRASGRGDERERKKHTHAATSLSISRSNSIVAYNNQNMANSTHNVRGKSHLLSSQVAMFASTASSSSSLISHQHQHPHQNHLHPHSSLFPPSLPPSIPSSAAPSVVSSVNNSPRRSQHNSDERKETPQRDEKQMGEILHHIPKNESMEMDMKTNGNVTVHLPITLSSRPSFSSPHPPSDEHSSQLSSLSPQSPVSPPSDVRQLDLGGQMKTKTKESFFIPGSIEDE